MTSSSVAAAGGRAPSERTSWPVAISPPLAVITAANASPIDCEPPPATGQPTACAANPSDSPMPAVSRASRGR